MCAERTVLYYAGALYPEVAIKALAVAGANKGQQTEEFVPPCGACRQVMMEMIKRHGDFDVILIGKQQTVCLKASALMPFAFTLL